jgi:hypothetical protein
VALELSDTELSNGKREIVTPFLALQADSVAANGLTLLVCLLELEPTALCVELGATELVSLAPRTGLVRRDELGVLWVQLDVLLELAFWFNVVGR